MAVIKLDKDVKTALLITVGDEDNDGKIGIQATVYGDMPFDGSSDPKQLIKLPEWEPVDADDIPRMVGDLLKFAGPVLGGLTSFFRKQ